jgi:hypothetical protein
MTERELQHLYGEDYLPQSKETQAALMCEEHESEDIDYILTGRKNNE